MSVETDQAATDQAATDQAATDTATPQAGETVRLVVGDLSSERVIRAVHTASDGTVTLEFED